MIYKTKLEAKQSLITGIEKVRDLVTISLGPSGRNVLFTNEFEELHSTKDGITIAKTITKLDDPIEDMGAQIIKKASHETVLHVGDGTTSTIELTYNIIKDGLKHINNNTNINEYINGLKDASKKAIQYIKENLSTDIKKDQLEQIATISANNDKTLGKLVVQAIESVGIEGMVQVLEKLNSRGLELEEVEGIQFSKGLKNQYFINNTEKGICVLNDVKILIYRGKINTAAQITPALSYLDRNKDKSLLIISDEIEGPALSISLLNKSQKQLKIACVGTPDIGDRKNNIIEDIAIITNATIIDEVAGLKLEKLDEKWLGGASIIKADLDTTTIINGAGDEGKINERIEHIKAQLNKATSQFEKEHIENRLSSMNGGMSIIHVGGYTSAEIKEKKDRIEDALQASKAAMAEGVVAGEGMSYYRAGINLFSLARELHTNGKSDDYIKGWLLLSSSLSSITRKLLENAGVNIEDIIEKIPIDNKEYGIDIYTKEPINLIEKGIIDPFKVIKVVIEISTNISATILLTDGCIYNPPPPSSMYNPMLGM